MQKRRLENSAYNKISVIKIHIKYTQKGIGDSVGDYIFTYTLSISTFM
jgi:hypothetical protein